MDTKTGRSLRIALFYPICASLVLGILSACNAPAKPAETPASTAAPVAPSQEQPAATIAFTQVTSVTQPVTTTVEETSPVKTYFNVIKSDGSTFAYTTKEQKKAVNVKFKIGDKVIRGPTLLEVLRIAGVTQFNQVTITGTNGSFTLAHADIDDKVVLSFTSTNTFKLAGAKIPEAQWIRDISEIRVQ